MRGSGSRRALPDLNTMQTAAPTRPVSARAAEDRDQRLYFKLSLLAAEKARLQHQLDTLRAKENAAVKRLEQVDKEVAGLRAEVAEPVGEAERRGLGQLAGLRSCREIEIEY